MLTDGEQRMLLRALPDAMNLTYGPGDVAPGPNEVEACLPVIERLLSERDQATKDRLEQRGCTVYVDHGQWNATLYGEYPTTVSALEPDLHDAIASAVAKSARAEEERAESEAKDLFRGLSPVMRKKIAALIEADKKPPVEDVPKGLE